MRRTLRWMVLSATGVVLLGSLHWQKVFHPPSLMVDYCGLLSGAYLLGTERLYSVPANLEVQRNLTGLADPARVYPRLPWVALLYRPFTGAPFITALWAWRSAMVLACALFLWLFPGSPRLPALAALAWSFPLFDGLAQGQDSALLLVWIAFALRLMRRQREFGAGLVLSLCTAKFHLFLLLPALLAVQRRWKTMAGLAGGTAGLLFVSFAMQGRRWPLDYLAVVMRPEINALPRIMPNFYGVFAGYRAGAALELAAGLLTVIAVIMICRRCSFEAGLAASVLGGFLVSRHVYIHDALVLAPALLLVAVQVPSLRPLTLTLLAPVVPFAVNSTSIGANVMVLLIGFLLVQLYLAVRRGAAPASGEAPVRQGDLTSP